MKDIKDYLHLYLGCEVLVDGETSGSLVGLSHTYDVELYVNNQWLHHRFCKLILRPLSDMTEEESQQYLSLQFPDKRYFDVAIEKTGICYREYKVQNKFMDFERIARNLNADSILYLLSKGFDLFGLIDVGLAIDKTTSCKRSSR